MNVVDGALKDRDDEKPQVVVMRDGDLTEAEAKEEETLQKKADDEKKVAEGKIAFKKPTKRETDDKEDKDEPRKKKDKSSKSEVKKVKQKSLLSFDEDEEEEC